MFFEKKKVFEFIGNKIGNFAGLEEWWEHKTDKRWAWILMEVDLRDGSLEEMELVYGNNSWVQCIDYWIFPF
jgi:hypothetical protein